MGTPSIPTKVFQSVLGKMTAMRYIDGSATTMRRRKTTILVFAEGVQ
jgi:hypothetical protein